MGEEDTITMVGQVEVVITGGNKSVMDRGIIMGVAKQDITEGLVLVSGIKMLGMISTDITGLSPLPPLHWGLELYNFWSLCCYAVSTKT